MHSSARLALYQYEALLVATRLLGIQTGRSGLRQSRTQMEDASNSITENLKELIQLKLGRYLPISV